MEDLLLVHPFSEPCWDGCVLVSPLFQRLNRHFFPARDGPLMACAQEVNGDIEAASAAEDPHVEDDDIRTPALRELSHREQGSTSSGGQGGGGSSMLRSMGLPDGLVSMALNAVLSYKAVRHNNQGK